MRLGTPLDYVVIAGYFLLVLGFGSVFGRHNRSTRDFFFGGQRFSWWLVALSMVATLVGSYSFIKYSAMGHRYGLASSTAYLNDWVWMPLFKKNSVLRSKNRPLSMLTAYSDRSWD